MKINMSLCQVPFNLLSLINSVFFCFEGQAVSGDNSYKVQVNCWLNHTRAFKNILNVVGTYFEC